MRTAANAITILRIVLAPILLFLRPGAAFAAVYLICGATDVLDGVLARRSRQPNPMGAALDSAADLLLFAVVGWRLLPRLSELPMLLWGAILLIAALRLISCTVLAVRSGRFALLHTRLNKVSGVLLFCAPPFLLRENTAYLYAAAAVILLSAVEELILVCARSCPDPDVRGLWR